MGKYFFLTVVILQILILNYFILINLHIFFFFIFGTWIFIILIYKLEYVNINNSSVLIMWLIYFWTLNIFYVYISLNHIFTLTSFILVLLNQFVLI